MTVDEFGDCIITRINDETGRCRHLYIERADPVILICREILKDARLAGDLVDDMLIIDAVNGQVVYRVMEFIPAKQMWRAEFAYGQSGSVDEQ
jgi:hypothetical protein